MNNGIWTRRSSFARFFSTFHENRPPCLTIQSRKHHQVSDNRNRFIRNTKETSSVTVARPLVFAPKSNSKRSILSLKGTASILEPKWAHLSPCIGAALSTSPLIGNLIKLGSLYSPENEDHHHGDTCYQHLYQTATLANHVFFQIMPESSLFLKRTKSAPAAYLTPRLIGTIVGQSILARQMEGSIQKYLLDEYDIRSNKIGDDWTGISLNRWMTLFRLSQVSSKDWMPLSVWSVALWEASHSTPASPQDCWLDYLIECDAHVQNVCQESIFRQDDKLAQGLKNRDPLAVMEWNEQVFCPNQDLNEAAFEKSMDQIIQLMKGDNDITTSGNDLLQGEDWTSALEIVCAAIAFGHSSRNANNDIALISDKPVVPDGYSFSVDGGDLKADCVEVTIREIIDLLLWNDNISAMDLSRLPPTASPKLVTFYKRLEQFRDDHNDEVFDAGKEWFDMLIALPGCDYLAVGKDQGIPYELAPSMDNVARVCHTLLMKGDTLDSSMDLASSQTSEWRSLEDIAHGWTYGPRLYVRSDTLIHGDASSFGGKAKKHEIATLQVEGNPNCIEIRMRCDWVEKSGFSAVTHLKESKYISDNDEREKSPWSCLRDASNSPFERIGKLIALSHTGTTDMDLMPSVDNDDIELLLLELLATRFGCDRRGIVHCTSHSDWKQQHEVQQEFDRQETKRNHLLLKQALHKICGLHIHDSELCKMLLVCFLQESGEVVEISKDSIVTMEVDEGLELMIASLPQDVLSSKAVQQAIWNCRSGIIRSKVLAACAELRSGTVSWWDVLLSDFSLGEVLSLISILHTSRG